MKKDKILLIGGGGHCKSCIDVIEEEGRFEIVGIVDKKEHVGEKVLGYEIIGSDEELGSFRFLCSNALITVGQIKTADTRRKIAQKLEDVGFTLPVIISPRAYVSKHAVISEGSIVLHHALVNADTKVGRHCIVNSKALIEHDTVVGDFCHIATAAVINGGCVLREGTFIGSNAVVKEYSEIGKNGFIKAGSLYRQ